MTFLYKVSMNKDQIYCVSSTEPTCDLSGFVLRKAVVFNVTLQASIPTVHILYTTIKSLDSIAKTANLNS